MSAIGISYSKGGFLVEVLIWNNAHTPLGALENGQAGGEGFSIVLAFFEGFNSIPSSWSLK
jgi:hypothetical protein